MSKAFQNEITLSQLQELSEEFNKGVTAYIFQSKLPFGDGTKRYIWTDARASKGITAVFDNDGIIQGLQFTLLSNYHETDEIYTKTVFDVPFQGEWLVFWGGLNSLVNYHYDYENQRYAYDFVMMIDDSSYDGGPALNNSYYTFGKVCLAPAGGRIVAIKKDVKDNESVGALNEGQPLGNYVIIDHGNEEYSYLVHFKYQSIEVNLGDKIN